MTYRDDSDATGYPGDMNEIQQHLLETGWCPVRGCCARLHECEEHASLTWEEK